MLERVGDFLRLSDAAASDDPSERIAEHQRILASKPAFREVVDDIQGHMRAAADVADRADGGASLELGTGVIAMRTEQDPVLASDIVPTPGLDVVADALALPFQVNSLRRVYAQNVFHHLADPTVFFGEVARCLRPGGVLVLLEPSYGALSSAVYPRLFAQEGYDKSLGWIQEPDGPMKGANQAQSFVVFVRDRDRLTREVPDLELVATQQLSEGVRYLLTGGLNFRQVLPARALRGVRRLEPRMPARVRQGVALHWLITLRRR